MTHPTRPQPPEPGRAVVARLVPADGRELPFGGAEIEALASGGIARATLRHLFVNDADAPLEATYHTPIPDGAAISGYAFLIGNRRSVGVIERRERSRERYQAAVRGGHTAALLVEKPGPFFTQRIGNIPPGTEVICELRLEHRLDWINGAYHWRFPTVIASPHRPAIGAGEAPVLEVDVLETTPPARASLELRIEGAAGDPASHTHRILCRDQGPARVVTLADENGCRLDRDLVVSWPAIAPAWLDAQRPSDPTSAGQSLAGADGLRGEADALRRILAREQVDERPARERQTAIERLGLDHRIATPRTSWVAVSTEETVDPDEPAQRVTIPQEKPFAVSAESTRPDPADRAGEAKRIPALRRSRGDAVATSGGSR